MVDGKSRQPELETLKDGGSNSATSVRRLWTGRSSDYCLQNSGHLENGPLEGEPDWHPGSARDGEHMRPTRQSIERRIRGLIEAFRPKVRPYVDPTECSTEEDNRRG